MRFYLPSSGNQEIKREVDRLSKRAGGVGILFNIIGADMYRKRTYPLTIERLEGLIDATVREMMLRRIEPPKHEQHSEYHKIWRVVDGAVSDAFYNHPDYLTEKGRRAARMSIVKRVTGEVLKSFAERQRGDPGLKSGV